MGDAVDVEVELQKEDVVVFFDIDDDMSEVDVDVEGKVVVHTVVQTVEQIEVGELGP